MADAWDPDQYGRFAAERSEPFWDLVDLAADRLGAPPGRMVDLGCGSGALTEAAARRLGAADCLGVDSSSAMLAEAVTHTRPGCRFAAGDIAEWTSAGDIDLVLANASLQWVPDHQQVIARWAAGLAPGGVLAVQVPANADHPAHRIAVEVALSEPFVSHFGGRPPVDPVAANVLAPEDYAVLLHELGLEARHVRLQVYGHDLGSSADVVEWVKGTTLTRFARVLPEELDRQLLVEYRRRLLAELGERSPYLYPFKRLLLAARRPR